MSNYLKPACAIFLPFSGKLVVSRFTNKELKQWFEKLSHPSYSPPTWLYAPATLVNFSCLGYGSYLIWKECGGFQGDGVLPLTCYGSTLAILWAYPALLNKSKKTSVLLFGWLAALGGTVATAATFNSVNSTAGKCVLPLLGWMLLTNIVAVGIWRKN